MWALTANHHARTGDWVGFLRTLDTTTPPSLVITDGAEELSNAVREVWPADPSQGLPVPFLARCEHHLRENVREELAADQVDHWGSVRMTLLNDAFRSPGGWEKFAGSVWPKHANAWKWVTANAGLVANQVAVRHLLPDHHSTAALDAHLVTVRDFLGSRSFVLRNARRTTTMLGLVRLHLNGVDNSRRYSELLRTHLGARGGVAPDQRNGYDTNTSVHLPRADRQPASLRR